MDNFKNQQLTILRRLGNVLNFSYNLQLVNKLAKHEPKTLVSTAEDFFNWQISEICQSAIKQKARFICFTGPSSSGKTTSAKKVMKELKMHGIKSRVISIDDFFVNKLDTPLKEDGTFDFENVTAVDIPFFKKFLKNILQNKPALKPTYDFKLGIRSQVTKIHPKEKEIFLFEGLHAFNPILFKGIPQRNIYKVFVTVSSNFTIGDEVVVNAKDIRLMRRLLRDYYTRNTSFDFTLDQWKDVCAGEAKYILPLRNSCNFILNTTHLYEPLLYDKYLRPLIEKYTESEHIQNLITIFNTTGKLSSEYIPKNSLIQEFIPQI